MGFMGKVKKWGKFHHGHEKALPVNSYPSRESNRLSWSVATKSLYRCCMDDRFSKVERNMEIHQKVALNMLILFDNSIKPWCCYYIANENDQI